MQNTIFMIALQRSITNLLTLFRSLAASWRTFAPRLLSCDSSLPAGVELPTSSTLESLAGVLTTGACWTRVGAAVFCSSRTIEREHQAMDLEGTADLPAKNIPLGIVRHGGMVGHKPGWSKAYSVVLFSRLLMFHTNSAFMRQPYGRQQRPKVLGRQS